MSFKCGAPSPRGAIKPKIIFVHVKCRRLRKLKLNVSRVVTDFTESPELSRSFSKTTFQMKLSLCSIQQHYPSCPSRFLQTVLTRSVTVYSLITIMIIIIIMLWIKSYIKMHNVVPSGGCCLHAPTASD